MLNMLIILYILNKIEKILKILSLLEIEEIEEVLGILRMLIILNILKMLRIQRILGVLVRGETYVDEPPGAPTRDRTTPGTKVLVPHSQLQYNSRDNNIAVAMTVCPPAINNNTVRTEGVRI